MSWCVTRFWRCRDDPDVVSVHLVVPDDAEVVNVRNLAQELALFRAILLKLCEAAVALIRRFPFEFRRFLVQPMLLFALLVGRERRAVVGEYAAERLAIENGRLPALRFNGLDPAVGIEMAVGLLRRPGVI